MPKCDLCLYKLECVLTEEECAITAIDDYDEGDPGYPHPAEIEFNLKTQYAKFIGSQLVVWVDEKTLRALASMRKMDHAGTDAPGESELQGYIDQARLCFVSKTAEETDDEMRAQGYKTSVCVCGLKSAYMNPVDEKCHHCGEPLTFT